MKKLFFLFMACCLSLTMSAKVAYLIPVAQRVNQDCQECDLPYEAYEVDDPDHEGQKKDLEQSPERRAFKWFRDEYTGEKTVLYLNDLANIPADVNAIWIHVDRVNFNTAAFDAVFTSEVKENLQAFVNRGGNLFLAKQAVRLEKDLVGAKKSNGDVITPGYACAGYIGAATWGMDYKFYDWNEELQRWGTNSGHAIFKDLPYADDNYAELIWSDSRQITNNNDIFSFEDMEMGDVWDGNQLWAFQNRNNCKVLAGWANGDGCHCGGLIEFYPTGDRKGTILVMGLAAYQWINNNAGNGFANTTKLTSNVLTYLNGPSRSDDVHIDDDFRADGREGADGDAHNRFMILHPNVRGLNAVAYDVIENAGITEKINDGANRLAFKNAGHVKLQIKLNETRGDQNWAQGIYTFTRDIDFAFNKNVQDVVNSDLSSNGRDGETGKFMLLHPNMQGMDSLNYAISFEGIEVANQAEVKKIKDGSATRLVFTKAGQVKLNITLKYSDNYNTEFGKGELYATKEINFAFDADKPVHGWSPTDLDDIKLNQEVVLYDFTQDLPVTYTFEPAENVTWDDENHKVKFIKAGDVKITASVTETKYLTGWPTGTHTYEKTVNVKSPLSWTQDPDVACVGEDNKYAHATTSVGTIVYAVEAGKEDYIEVASDGKITFKKDCADPIAITASVTVDGYTYSLTKTTRCNAPTINWKTAPAASGKYDESLTFETELLYGPATIQYTPNNCEIKDGKIHLTGIGEATVQPYVEYPYGEGKLTYTGDTKTITVAAPVVSWAKDGEGHDMVPEDAAIKEESYKRTPSAGCDVPSLTVKYRSADPTKISIDENTGALQYLAPTTGDGIDITAYVTVNDIEYSISHKTKCLKPSVEWVTEPSATGVVGLDMAYAAKVKYGDATIGYDYTNCTVVDGKLHFAAAGTAIVRPYASAYDVKYYDDNVLDFNIEVAEPTFTWVVDPSNAAVTEAKPAVEITVNNGMTVLYKSTDENVATVAADGKLTYRHAGTTNIYGYVVVGETTYESEKKPAEVSGMTVNWDAEKVPGATATNGDEIEIAARPIYGSAVAKFLTNENCSYNSETKKLTFLHAGTATVQPYVEGYDDEKFYGDPKNITVSPDLKWVAENPMSGCVGETGKTAIATTTDGTIVYSSSDDEKVSVDSEGNLTFHAIDEATTVTIYATVTIGETPYQISGEIDANLPNVYWVDDKKPGETYRKDETPDAEAKLEYGPGVVNYEVSNCSWAADKLTFAAEGEATVQPYVEYESHKYYGEKITITVTPATTTYTRTVTPGRYGTICLERTPTKIEGCTFWQPESLVEDGSTVVSVKLAEVQVGDEALKAGYGYFFLATNSEIRVTMSLAEEALDEPVVHDVENGIYTHGMHGTFTKKLDVPNSTNECILSNNELRYGAGAYVQDHRAYIKLSEVEDGPAAAPGRRRVTMGVNQPSVTTDMELIPLDGEHATKVMINGQIYILRADRIYTVDGQLVK